MNRGTGTGSKYRQTMKVFVVCLGLSLTAACARTGDVGAKPDLNASFSDQPKVQEYIERFEREGREIYDHRDAIIEQLDIKPGLAIADVGAGTGFFSLMMAKKAGPSGKVYSVDIAQNFLVHIRKTAAEQGLENIETVLCDQRSTRLPKRSVDLIFISDTYHHFEHPVQTLASIHRALRPGGRLAIIDFEKIEGDSTDWVLDHIRCGKLTVIDEVQAAGFGYVREVPMMEDQYYILFEKSETGS